MVTGHCSHGNSSSKQFTRTAVVKVTDRVSHNLHIQYILYTVIYTYIHTYQLHSVININIKFLHFFFTPN